MELPVTEALETLFLEGTPLLDVRAPVEFAQGAFPSACNLPLMNDEERHLVGQRYQSQGQEQAIALGHQLVKGAVRAARVEAWVRFLDQHPDARLYCFRGGLRSRISQQWLHEAGRQVPRVAGGYKAMRRFLIDSLPASLQPLSVVVLAGRTGSGKTLLLARLPESIDLEALAGHRGSSFGRLLTPQPTNIDFENALAVSLLKRQHRVSRAHVGGSRLPVSETAPVFFEDEGRIIGRVRLPPVLSDALLQAPVVILETSLAERISVTRDAYVSELIQRYQHRDGPEAGIDSFAEHHRDSLARIQRRFGGLRYQQSLAQFDEALADYRQQQNPAAFDTYLKTLLTDYYDPMYDYQMQQKQRRVLFQGHAEEIVEWAARYATTR